MNTVATEMTHEQSAGGGATSRISVFSHVLLGADAREQLLQARDVLEQGLENVSRARLATSRTDGKCIADVLWAKVGFCFVLRLVEETRIVLTETCCKKRQE